MTRFVFKVTMDVQRLLLLALLVGQWASARGDYVWPEIKEDTPDAIGMRRLRAASIPRNKNDGKNQDTIQEIEFLQDSEDARWLQYGSFMSFPSITTAHPSKVIFSLLPCSTNLSMDILPLTLSTHCFA
jgi:hypothetical protein